MYGKLTVVSGCMFAGKTSYLVNECKIVENPIVYKPAMDVRYSEKECVTHDGVSITAIPVSSSREIIVDQYSLICIDEIQFFSKPHFDGDIVFTIHQLLRKGNDVLVCGLDMDWQGNPFQNTSLLMGMADCVVKLSAKCSICGAPATKTAKKFNDDQIIQLGNENIYSPRCNKHWFIPD